MIASFSSDNAEAEFHVACLPRTDPKFDMSNFSVLDRRARIEEEQARINFETSRTAHGRSRSPRFSRLSLPNAERDGFVTSVIRGGSDSAPNSSQSNRAVAPSYHHGVGA